MATENKGIITNAGLSLRSRVDAGQTKITYTKVVFSSDDNIALDDSQVKALTDIKTKDVIVAPPVVTLEDSTGETRIRALGTNEKLKEGMYAKTYGVYAKDDEGTEILYGVTLTSTPDYLPPFDNVTTQSIAYTYKANISDTDHVVFTDSKDVYLTQEDLNVKLSEFPKQSDLDKYALISSLATYATVDQVTKMLADNKVTLPDDIAYTDKDATISGQYDFSKKDAKGVDGTAYVTQNQMGQSLGTIPDELDKKAADTNVVHRDPNTGKATDKTDFPAGNLTVGDKQVYGLSGVADENSAKTVSSSDLSALYWYEEK